MKRACLALRAQAYDAHMYVLARRLVASRTRVLGPLLPACLSHIHDMLSLLVYLSYITYVCLVLGCLRLPNPACPSVLCTYSYSVRTLSTSTFRPLLLSPPSFLPQSVTTPAPSLALPNITSSLAHFLRLAIASCRTCTEPRACSRCCCRPSCSCVLTLHAIMFALVSAGNLSPPRIPSHHLLACVPRTLNVCRIHRRAHADESVTDALRCRDKHKIGPGVH
jgi:hypothetical protein